MTLRSLYRKVLEELEVVAAGDPADPDDTALVEDKYDALYDMLLTKRLVAWGADEDVPDNAVIPLTWMLAYVCASSFGVDDSALAQKGALDLPHPSLAERQLRAQLAANYVSYPAQTEYF